MKLLDWTSTEDNIVYCMKLLLINFLLCEMIIVQILIIINVYLSNCTMLADGNYGGI